MLRGRVGERFAGVVVDVDDDDHRRGSVTVAEPAIEAPARRDAGDLPLGEEARGDVDRGRPPEPPGAVLGRLTARGSTARSAGNEDAGVDAVLR